MIYVTSDIHGYYDEFLQMLEVIGFSPEDYLYIIGDVLDRGPKPLELLRYVMEQPNIELLIGNHEDAFMWAVHKNTSQFSEKLIMDFWMGHGGDITFGQFSQLTEDEQDLFIEYLSVCPRYKILSDDTVLVHAAVLTDKVKYNTLKELMEQQDDFAMVWEVADFIKHPFHMKYGRMIFGHTFTLMIREMVGQALDSVEIWKDGQRLGIDCGYQFGGRMAFLRLDDMKEYYLSPSGVVTIK